MFARHIRWIAVVMAAAVLVAACSEGGAEPDADGLVAWFPLDGDAVDAAGDSDGTVTAAVAVADRSGAEGAALRFTEGAYAEFEHTAALDLANEFTIAVWIDLEPGAEPGSYETIFEKSDPERDGHSRYGLWIRDGLLSTCFEASDNSRQPCAETNVILTDGWHHVAAVRAGRRALLYIDGEVVRDGFVGLYDISQTPFSAFIGTDRYQSSAAWLHASLDDLRIYDRPLDAAEVATLASG